RLGSATFCIRLEARDTSHEACCDSSTRTAPESGAETLLRRCSSRYASVQPHWLPCPSSLPPKPHPSAVYLRVAGANNSIVRDARVFLASPWSRRRLTMGAYSMDLRERVAAAIDEGEGSERQIAKRFRVSVSFVTRLLQRRRDAGTLAPKPHGGGPRPV